MNSVSVMWRWAGESCRCRERERGEEDQMVKERGQEMGSERRRRTGKGGRRDAQREDGGGYGQSQGNEERQTEGNRDKGAVCVGCILHSHSQSIMKLYVLEACAFSFLSFPFTLQ